MRYYVFAIVLCNLKNTKNRINNKAIMKNIITVMTLGLMTFSYSIYGQSEKRE
ncbi:hypothetical protein SAMN04487891_11045 [Flagellimonas taeanensis]|uniref:Uncharacterized protein n=1 Tax=Flagellimonas taeanensis TaxID=1005926 RepID=A0A1M7B7T4_9FLAO|nr:hypothetical protein SAMN04487891_11045 [Allomuricauda taeanensis]SHL50689.1 hypothetical protein SAMN05216293_3603 [Allomuricauda taeanensis]